MSEGRKNTVKGIHQMIVPTPFPVGDVNMYLVEGDALTLVDAGVKTEEAWESFRMQLKDIGYKPEDIEQVVLTHHHPDHVGLLDYLPERMPVIGQWRNEPWISRDEQFYEQHDTFFTELFHAAGIDPYFLKFIPGLKRTMKFSCNRSLTESFKEGDEVKGMPGWKVVETPGHAQSHVVLYRERDGLMIGGDFLLKHISSNPLLEPPYPGEMERPKTQLQYNDSLKKALQYDISRVLPGHGHDVTSAHTLIELRLGKQDRRARTIHEWLKERPMTAFAICKKMFPTVFQKELSLTMSETFGQLDYLEAIGAVSVDRSSKAWCYYAK